jgi:F420-non-reducing hydrogenase small subunit
VVTILVKICTVSLTCCGGCLSSLVNIGEVLFSILEEVEVVYWPTFVDLKEIKHVDLAIVEGGIRTEEDEEVIHEVRAKSNTLLALGICATHGGVTSLGNIFSLKKALEEEYPRVYRRATSLPKLKDMMYPIDNFVDVDIYIPGCPPMPTLIHKTLQSWLKGEKPERHKGVVCLECNRKIVAVKPGRLKRIYEEQDDPEICLLSQGFICLGSLTRDGCGAPCPRVGFTCFGCRGPPDTLNYYRSRDLYDFLIRVTSRRTGIDIEEIKKELYQNPFVFHTFIFSKKMERFKSMERII